MSRRITPMAAVAGIGTGVGMLGVGHAMYGALAGHGHGLNPGALAEASIAALFLELVVASCALRARQRASGARSARLDVLVVLAAAVASGIVAGWAAGWGPAGLFRLIVPPIASLVWLGDVIGELRQHRETDHERALRAVIACVCRRVQAERARVARGWRVHRADVELVRRMAVYASADGDRAELVSRLDEVHHRADLLAPMGASPWRVSGDIGTSVQSAALGVAAPPWDQVEGARDGQSEGHPEGDEKLLADLRTWARTLSEPPSLAAIQERYVVGPDRARGLLLDMWEQVMSARGPALDEQPKSTPQERPQEHPHVQSEEHPKGTSQERVKSTPESTAKGARQEQGRGRGAGLPAGVASARELDDDQLAELYRAWLTVLDGPPSARKVAHHFGMDQGRAARVRRLGEERVNGYGREASS